AFLSNRDGASQVYLLELAGGEAIRATSLPEGVDAFEWLDERTLLVTSDVRPDGAKENEKPPASTARVYSRLFVRHWDTRDDLKRAHLFVAPIDGSPVRDLTPGDHDVPPFSLGGPDDFGASPDGKEVCFSRNDDPLPAVSTNADLFVVPVAGGEPRKIASNPG